MSTTEQHTPKLVLRGRSGRFPDSAVLIGILDGVNDSYEAEVPEKDNTEEARRAARDTARRLVACWNALDGVPTEAVEAGVITELVQALEESTLDARLIASPSELLDLLNRCARWIETCASPNYALAEEARAAIAKATTQDSQ